MDTLNTPRPGRTKPFVNEQLIKLGKELGIPCVLTCDAHYLLPDDQMAHEVLLCIQTGAFLSDKNALA